MSSTKSLEELISIDTNCTNRIKPIDTIDTDTESTIVRKYDCDYLYEELPDLVNAQYRGWYMRQFYRLGRERVMRLASVARLEGRDPKRYFTQLLRTTS